MNFHTFGNENNQVMVLIHGMLTPWQIWEDAAEHFSKDYFVIVPELDGHTEEEESELISVEDEAEKIRQYLLDHCSGKVSVVAGLSLGGRISAVLAGMPGLHIDSLIIDGAPLMKIPGLYISVMTKNYIQIIQKSRKKDPKVIKSFNSFLPEKFLDDYLKLADHMGEQSIGNVMKSVFDSFDFKTYDEDMRILFMHGTKGNEIVSGKSAVKMKKANPQTEIKVFKGYAHAELACFKSGDWIREVSDWLGEK